MDMAEQIMSGDVVAMSRFIRDVDDGEPKALATLRELFKHSGNASIIGITGTPGAGKSTLVSLIIGHYRKIGKSVGVVAVDPTSPFSGGAILGDRIRMQEHNSDAGVFIRSVATRGAFGGLSRSVVDIVRVLEAAGKDIIIIETVGVGQDEIDIFGIAGQVLVVTAPGLGDDIQAIKAGLLEIADIFVVNKCDLPGAKVAARDLREIADDHKRGGAKPVVLTDAIRGDGIPELIENIQAGFEKYADAQTRSQYLRRRYRYEIELKVRDHVLSLVRDAFENNAAFAKILDDVSEKRIDPYSATARAMERFTVK